MSTANAIQHQVRRGDRLPMQTAVHCHMSRPQRTATLALTDRTPQYDMAVKFQQNQPDNITVLLLGEIGLAEHSLL